MEELEKRVDNGITFLTENRPEILHHTNLKTLDLNSLCKCVLGQAFGNYDTGLKELGLSPAEAVLNGFALGLDDDEHRETELTPIWKTKLRAWRWAQKVGRQ